MPLLRYMLYTWSRITNSNASARGRMTSAHLSKDLEKLSVSYCEVSQQCETTQLQAVYLKWSVKVSEGLLIQNMRAAEQEALHQWMAQDLAAIQRYASLWESRSTVWSEITVVPYCHVAVFHINNATAVVNTTVLAGAYWCIQHSQSSIIILLDSLFCSPGDSEFNIHSLLALRLHDQLVANCICSLFGAERMLIVFEDACHQPVRLSSKKNTSWLCRLIHYNLLLLLLLLACPVGLPVPEFIYTINMLLHCHFSARKRFDPPAAEDRP